MIAGFFAFIPFFTTPFLDILNGHNPEPEQDSYDVCNSYKWGENRLDPAPGQGRKTARFQANTTGTLNALHRGTVRVRSL
jgi:hypothetical protein